MAERAIYAVISRKPFYEARFVNFTYNGGFSASQKQKNIEAIHAAYRMKYPEAKLLEISSKSTEAIGKALSAFALTKFVPSLDKAIPVENVYQGGKVLSIGGPFTDLYETTPKEAKRDERLKHPVMGFSFEGKMYPTTPKTAFYDWIYINALLEHPEYLEELAAYDGFTDVEFNPNKSINCQARAVAIAVSLYRAGRLEEVRDFYQFCKLI